MNEPIDDKKILFLVDHKHRDLPALSLISYFMNRFGCVARLIGLGFEDKIVEEFDPGFIVLPKPVYNFKKFIEWKMQGRKIIVIDTEGNPQDIAYKMNIRVAPDLYCFWNETIKERYRPQLERSGTTLKVLGFLRSDLLHGKYRDLFPDREHLLSSYGLDHTKKTITIATSTQDSHFSDTRVKKKYKRRNNSLSETADYMDIVANMRRLRAITENMIKTICAEFPDVNLAIKPHPHENVVYWNDLLGTLGAKNIGLVIGQPINHLLKVSDLHIAHNVCTTTIESLMADVPTVEVHTEQSERLYRPEHLFMANYIIKDSVEIIPVIKKVIQGDKKVLGLESVENKSNLDDYVETYFHKFDGRRCFEYARTLCDHMKREPRKKSAKLNWFLDSPQTLVPYAIVKGRSFLQRMRILSSSKKIETQVNAPTKNNEREIYEINGVLVDKEYGLYDNRMKSGDELTWYARFEKNGYIDELVNRNQ